MASAMEPMGMDRTAMAMHLRRMAMAISTATGTGSRPTVMAIQMDTTVMAMVIEGTIAITAAAVSGTG